MVYLKSVLAGLVGSILAGIFFPFVSCLFALFLRGKPTGDGDSVVTWDLRSALGSPLFRWAYALTVVLLFVISFFWELRRASS
jgi:hypothetical protein